MIGELAALSAALLWAISSILFADIGKHLRAININLLKGGLAAALMLLVLCCGSLFSVEGFSLNSLTSLSQDSFMLLILSGIIGIGAGDTAFFACLRRIGPQKGLMLESTAPIIAAILALLLFQEFLDSLAWFGIFLTTTGVILVIYFTQSKFEYSTTFVGVFFGLIAALCQATGIVLSRKVFLTAQVEPFASALIRLTGALVVIVIWIGIRSGLHRKSSPPQSLAEALSLLHHNGLILRLICAIILGTFLAIWLMQTSVKHTSAGITQTLLATCPLFGMLIGVLQGQQQKTTVWLGLSLGIAGIGLLFLR